MLINDLVSNYKLAFFRGQKIAQTITLQLKHRYKIQLLTFGV